MDVKVNSNNPIMDQVQSLASRMEAIKNESDLVLNGLFNVLYDLSEVATNERTTELEKRVTELTEALDSAIIEKMTEKDCAASLEIQLKEQTWIANQLGQFVKELGAGIYEGQEKAAATRLYDLNCNSLKRPLVNAYLYDTIEEAREAFANANVSGSFGDWLYSPVRGLGGN
jgi:hypothetical protein